MPMKSMNIMNGLTCSPRSGTSSPSVFPVSPPFARRFSCDRWHRGRQPRRATACANGRGHGERQPRGARLTIRRRASHGASPRRAAARGALPEARSKTSPPSSGRAEQRGHHGGAGFSIARAPAAATHRWHTWPAPAGRCNSRNWTSFRPPLWRVLPAENTQPQRPSLRAHVHPPAPSARELSVISAFWI